jgi:hypothetical protein
LLLHYIGLVSKRAIAGHLYLTEAQKAVDDKVISFIKKHLTERMRVR